MMQRVCIKCGATLDISKHPDVCSYCNFHRYGENGEYAPSPELVDELTKMYSAPKSRKQRRQQKGFTDEEILALGLYPKDDECYKMSLISRILGK